MGCILNTNTLGVTSTPWKWLNICSYSGSESHPNQAATPTCLLPPTAVADAEDAAEEGDEENTRLCLLFCIVMVLVELWWTPPLPLAQQHSETKRQYR